MQSAYDYIHTWNLDVLVIALQNYVHLLKLRTVGIAEDYSLSKSYYHYYVCLYIINSQQLK